MVYSTTYNFVDVLLTLLKENQSHIKMLGKITVMQKFLHFMFKKTLELQKLHHIEIAHMSKKLLNQTFTNKIGLSKNANIHKNILYENNEIKGRIQIVTCPFSTILFF